MNKQTTTIDGSYVVTPQLYHDNRGYFCELFRGDYAQGNLSYSIAGVLRGMHYQKVPHAQAKLVRCIHGEIYDVIIDIRKNSPTFLQKYEIVLSHNNVSSLYVPAGCLHGFLAMQDSVVEYLVDKVYTPESEGGFYPYSIEFWTMGVRWPCCSSIIIGEKDQKLPEFDVTLL